MRPPQETPISHSSPKSREPLPSISISAALSPLDERGSRSRASSAYIPSHTRHLAVSPSTTQTVSQRRCVGSHTQPQYGDTQPKWSPIASPLHARDETPYSGIASFQEALSPYGHRQYITSDFIVTKPQQFNGDVKEKRHRKESSIASGKRVHYG